jgi:hypothetical protein
MLPAGTGSKEAKHKRSLEQGLSNPLANAVDSWYGILPGSFTFFTSAARIWAYAVSGRSDQPSPATTRKIEIKVKARIILFMESPHSGS